MYWYWSLVHCLSHSRPNNPAVEWTYTMAQRGPCNVVFMASMAIGVTPDQLLGQTNAQTQGQYNQSPKKDESKTDNKA